MSSSTVEPAGDEVHSAPLQLVPVDALPTAAQAAVAAMHEQAFGHWASWQQLYGGRPVNEEILAITAAGNSDKPVAYAVFRFFPRATDLCFLRFLVVDESLRGQRLGTRIWPLLLAHAGVGGGGAEGGAGGRTIMCWDVEHPEQEGLSQQEQTLRRKRVQFYQRLGGTLLPIHDYTNPHDEEEMPMLLLAMHVDGSVPFPKDSASLAEHIRKQVDLHRWGRDKPVPATKKAMSGVQTAAAL